MTKTQIKAELRDVACGEFFPMFAFLSEDACDAAESFLPIGVAEWDHDCENKRFFFLLVAEAL